MDDADRHKVGVELADSMRSMTPKQVGYFAQQIADPGCDNSEAARAAGYKLKEGAKPSNIHKTVMAAGARRVIPVLERFGLDEIAVTAKLIEGIHATSIHPMIKKIWDDGTIVGEEIIEVEVNDPKTQLGYLKLLTQLLDLHPAKRHQVEHTKRSVTDQKLAEMVQELAPEDVTNLANAEIMETTCEEVSDGS